MNKISVGTNLIGRTKLLRELLIGTTRDFPDSYGIFGLKGMGKTTLLQQMATLLKDGEKLRDWGAQIGWDTSTLPETIPVYLDLGGWDGEQALPRIQAALSKALTSVRRAAFSTFQPIEASSGGDLQTLVGLIRDSELRFVLLIDDFDSVYQGLSRADEIALRGELPIIPAVFATEEPWAPLKRENAIWSPLERYCELRDLEPLSFEEARTLICNNHDKESAEFASSLPECAFSLSGGIPGLLLRIAESLKEMKLPSEELRILKLSSERGNQLAHKLLAKQRGLRNDFQVLWEQLTGEEQNLLLDMVTSGKPIPRVTRVASDRLIPWFLLQEEGNGYRIGPLLFAYYVRLYGQSASSPSVPQQGQHSAAGRLLAYLQQHPDMLIPYDQLLQEIWGDASLSGRQVDNALLRLRRSLGREAFETIYGKGIRYRPQYVQNPSSSQPGAGRPSSISDEIQ